VEKVAKLIALVHAPVLGPASWQPASGELSRAGHQVAVPALAGFTSGGPPYAPRLVQLCAEQITQAAEQVEASRPGPAVQVTMVVHSGAGSFADQIAATLRTGSVAVIYADAGLPSQSGPSRVVDARFLPYLQDIASNGIVPPWHEWWPDADPAELFPNEAARAAVLASARPLPLAFFEETLPPTPQDRRPHRAGYLLFSDGYRPEADEARQRGWPVTELAGSHLHPLASPAQVAAAIAGLDQSLWRNG
jgi:hypothetical protein